MLLLVASPVVATNRTINMECSVDVRAKLWNAGNPVILLQGLIGARSSFTLESAVALDGQGLALGCCNCNVALTFAGSNQQ